MKELIIAFGLFLFIEGILYALFPSKMKKISWPLSLKWKPLKMITNDFLSYLIPTRLEIKKLTTEFAVSYEASGPYGAKSVGEIGIDTPPAALANAVFNATGVRIKTLPITAEKIYQGMLELKQKENKK